MIRTDWALCLAANFVMWIAIVQLIKSVAEIFQ